MNQISCSDIFSKPIFLKAYLAHTTVADEIRASSRPKKKKVCYFSLYYSFLIYSFFELGRVGFFRRTGASKLLSQHSYVPCSVITVYNQCQCYFIVMVAPLLFFLLFLRYINLSFEDQSNFWYVKFSRFLVAYLSTTVYFLLYFPFIVFSPSFMCDVKI